MFSSSLKEPTKYGFSLWICSPLQIIPVKAVPMNPQLPKETEIMVDNGKGCTGNSQTLWG